MLCTMRKLSGKSTGDRPRLTWNSGAAKNITNPEGKKMQAEVWKEIVGILVAAVPEVSGIVSGKALF